MTLVDFDSDGPVGGFAPGEYLECSACGQTFGSGDYLLADSPPTADGGPTCPACDRVGTFVRRSSARGRTVRDRWPGIGDTGWYPVPNHFPRHAALLGLDPTDIGLMIAFGAYQIDPTRRVFPSFRRIAAETGTSERTVRSRVAKWVRLGLWDKYPRQRPDGGNSTCALNNDGLRRALARIAANTRAGNSPTEGLAEVLEDTASRATPRQHLPHPQASDAAPPSSNCRAEEQAVEEEQSEEELSCGKGDQSSPSVLSRQFEAAFEKANAAVALETRSGSAT